MSACTIRPGPARFRPRERFPIQSRGSVDRESASRRFESVEFGFGDGNFFLQAGNVAGLVGLLLGAGQLLPQLLQFLMQDVDPFLGFLIHQAPRRVWLRLAWAAWARR